MTEKTVTVGDTEVTLEATDDGVEIVEQMDTFEAYLNDEYPWCGVIPQGENTAYSDCEYALQPKLGYFSQSKVRSVVDDEIIRATWIDTHDGNLQMGVIQAEQT